MVGRHPPEQRGYLLSSFFGRAGSVTVRAPSSGFLAGADSPDPDPSSLFVVSSLSFLAVAGCLLREGVFTRFGAGSERWRR